jgi:nucleotide-binding universal stress UspA family protein
MPKTKLCLKRKLKPQLMETFLCLTDFSATGENAARYADALARGLAARLVLFHNIYEPVDAIYVEYEGRLGGGPSLDQEYWEVQQHKLALLRASLQPESGPAYATCLKYGRAKNTVAEAAREVAADLIVIGQDGAGGMRQMLSDSALAEVLATAPCPILVIPARSVFRPLRRVVIATGLAGESFTGMALVLALAGLAGGELLLLHILPDDAPVSWRQARARLNRLQKRLPYPHVTCHTLLSAHLEAGLSQFCWRQQADMLVMGYHPSPFWEHLMHQTPAQEMARHSTRPLLILPYCH